MKVRAIARGTAAAGAAALALATLGAAAQDGGGAAPPNPRLTFGVEQRFSTDDNLDLDPVSLGRSTLAITRLSLGYLTETRSSRLAFDAATSLRLTDGPDTDGTEFEFDNTRVTLDYLREAANGTLSFDASYAESQIDTLQSLSDFGPGIEVPADFANLNGTGTRTDYSLNAALRLNEGAPIGYRIDAGLAALRYVDTTDPSLFDSDRTTLGASAILTLTPVTEATIGLRYSDFSSDDPADAGGGTGRIDLGLTQTLPGGTLGGVIFAEDQETEDGTRAGFSLTRAMDLPAGALSVSLGATRLPGTDTELTGALNWRQDLPQGVITAEASRAVTQDNEDETRLVTALRLGYNQELTPLSRLGLDLSYALSEATTSTDQTESASFGATYSHDVTEDWALDLGYRYRTRDEDADGRGNSNSVFLALRRTFDVRP